MLKLITGTLLWVALVIGTALIMLNLFAAYVTLVDGAVIGALKNFAR